MLNPLASFLLALQFLTRLPVPLGNLYSEARMAASVGYHPLVGCLIGALLAGIYSLLLMLFPIPVTVLLTLAASLMLTGAFHEDGLADTADGVGGSFTRERALEIMRDSRLGTYGSLALGMSMAIRAAVLMSLPPELVPAALVAGHGLSRLSSVLVIATSGYVRDEGTGKPVAKGMSGRSLTVALGTGLLILLAWVLLLPVSALLYTMVGMLLGHLAMRRLFEAKLGGYTGDTLGAVQQLSEIGGYLGLLAWT